MRILVISDNPFLVGEFNRIISLPVYLNCETTYLCSKGSEQNLASVLGYAVDAVKVKTQWEQLLGFDIIFSLHCKQLFPAELVSKVRCVNVHPGLNPYNRGWFPQVFSILNGLPTGATIHEIDEELDHGKIIAQQEVKNYSWDTSIDIYNRVQQAEVQLLESHLTPILESTYNAVSPSEEGNLNLKKDFDNLCKLNLDQTQTLGKSIDLLRALTHGSYKNAFFIDPKTGKKVYVSVSFEVEE